LFQVAVSIVEQKEVADAGREHEGGTVSEGIEKTQIGTGSGGGGCPCCGLLVRMLPDLSQAKSHNTARAEYDRSAVSARYWALKSPSSMCVCVTHAKVQ